MKRFRFHIGTLVILVLLLGVGFAALRESDETWDSGIFSLTLAVLLTSILLAIHRTEKRRPFWLGFALFRSAYLGLSLVPSIESRLITTHTLAYLDAKMPRSIPASVALYDLLVVNNSQPNALYRNQGNVVFEDVTAVAGLNPAGKEVMGKGWVSKVLVGTALAGSSGTTENFVRIGHSLLALIAAFCTFPENP
jgi:hypothetical protein